MQCAILCQQMTERKLSELSPRIRSCGGRCPACQIHLAVSTAAFRCQLGLVVPINDLNQQCGVRQYTPTVPADLHTRHC